MTRRKFLFIHQNFPGQFVHAALELAGEVLVDHYCPVK